MLNRRSCFTTLIPCNLFEGPHTFQKTTVWWSTSGRFPFRDFWPEIKWNGKSFENLRIRFKCTLFDGISTIIETFAKGVGFNLPTEHEVTRTSEKKKQYWETKHLQQINARDHEFWEVIGGVLFH